MPDTIAGLLHGLISALNRYSSRWERLILHCPTELIRLFCGDSYGVPILRTLNLEPLDELHEDEVDSYFSFRMAGPKPTPTCVQINKFWFRLLNIDWSHVTKVRFDNNIYLNDCVELLRLASQLVECHIMYALDSQWTQPSPMVSIVHHALQSFRFGEYEGDDLNQFFDIVSFPRLTLLELDGLMSGYEDEEIILETTIGLISRSSCPLTSLRLCEIEHNSDVLIRLLWNTPHVRELAIISRSVDIINFFRDFAYTLDAASDKSEESFLFSLRSILYEDHYLQWDNNLWALMPVIVLRLQGKDKPGCPSGTDGRSLKMISIISHFPYKLTPICMDKQIVLRIIEFAQAGVIWDLRHNDTDLLEMSIEHHGIVKPGL